MASELEDLSIFDLFRMEAEEQVRILQSELLACEREGATPERLEALMRAAHSLKGAARIVGLDAIVDLTHAMEDRLVAAQSGVPLAEGDIGRLLTATDWLAKLQEIPEAEMLAWLGEQAKVLAVITDDFGSGGVSQVAAAAPNAQASKPRQEEVPDDFSESKGDEHKASDRQVRLAAERFDAILSLASESLVTARQLAETAEAMNRIHRRSARALRTLEEDSSTPEERAAAVKSLLKQDAASAVKLAEVDALIRANEQTVEHLYRTVLAGRLRPFSEGIGGVERLVRDTSRSLGKLVSFDLLGERTRVDRDILEGLKSPITHLISNAIDHGIELPAERLATGKPAKATLKLHARHERGRLVVTVRDDGRGIRVEEVRRAVVRRSLASESVANGLSDSELMEFLFLPGFSTRDTVSTVSGRGVGLNAVQQMIQQSGGSVSVTSEPGAGSVFRLSLPVTRSVIKVITVESEGERYALPLVRIDRVAQVSIALDEDGEAVASLGEERLKVVSLATLLGLSALPLAAGSCLAVCCGETAFAVDKLVNETELFVRELDPRLGKIPGISAASIDENGLPILILDVEELLQAARDSSPAAATQAGESSAPSILVVDDSHTVREITRRILAKEGYNITTAQNGLQAWNLLRLHTFDLVISDVDMPGMNGIELVTKMRGNVRLERIPVIILSYKDRAEDRQRGLDAGADYYLTKGDFQKAALRRIVVDLIGEATP